MAFPLKMCLFLVASRISSEKPSVVLIIFSFIDNPRLPSCFQDFPFLSFSFSFFLLWCVNIDFLGLCYLGYTQFLESVGFCLLPDLGSFQSLFFQISFSPHFFLSPYRTPHGTNVRTCATISRVPGALFVSFLFSLWCADQAISIVLSPSSLILSPVIFVLPVNTSNEVF